MAQSSDLTGKVFGRLRVVREVDRIGQYRMWRCRCTCNKLTTVRGSNLTSGMSKSCGCYRTPQDLTGKTFGFCRVERMIEDRGRSTLWLCRCDCGTTFSALRSYLVGKENVPSCGCHRTAMKRENGRLGTRHGHGSNFERPVEYVAWGKARSINEIVSPEFDDFTRFLEIVGPKPSPDHRLTYLDRPKGFVPGNVEWRHYPKRADPKPRTEPGPAPASPLPAMPSLPWARPGSNA